MITTLLFDMDGLIFDTESVYKLSWQHAANNQGFDLTDDLYQHFYGVQDSQCELMVQESFGATLNLQQFKNERDVHFHQSRANGIALKPGFEALFQSLEGKNLRCGLVTSSPLADVKHNFKNSKYLERFELVITAEDVKHGKPAPDSYLLACKKLNVTPQECLVLEDSNNGVLAGLNAGCQVVMVPDMLPPKKDIIGNVTIVESLDKVIDLLPTN
jgi:HAD superfamily hydrolase (TIGR01509 family)